MNFLISGGTGFVGKHLCKALHEKGHHTFVLTRSPSDHENTFDTTYIGYDLPADQLPEMEGVINLAGESLFGYWTEEKKERIKQSRYDVTSHLISLIAKMKTKPSVFISGSAVGYYGNSEDLIFTEATTSPGKGFLSDVTVAWEELASQAEALGTRTILARFGIILGNEGSLPLMSLPVKLFASGKIGNGEQWMSWIHIDDVVRLLEYCLFQENMEGPVNFTAPEPLRNKEFMRSLAKTLHRPNWTMVPKAAVYMAAGEMGQLITRGQYVLPKKALDSGYVFAYPTVKEAFKNIHGK